MNVSERPAEAMIFRVAESLFDLHASRVLRDDGRRIDLQGRCKEPRIASALPELPLVLRRRRWGVAARLATLSNKDKASEHLATVAVELTLAEVSRSGGCSRVDLLFGESSALTPHGRSASDTADVVPAQGRDFTEKRAVKTGVSDDDRSAANGQDCSQDLQKLALDLRIAQQLFRMNLGIDRQRSPSHRNCGDQCSMANHLRPIDDHDRMRVSRQDSRSDRSEERPVLRVQARIRE